MFHHHGKKRSAQSRPLSDLTAVNTAPLLLADNKRQALIQKISDSLALDASRLESLCLKLFNAFATQCQRLPETANSYYSQPAGLLDHALNRTEAALHLLRQHMVQEQSTTPSEEQQRWLYTLFSAAILQGIGKLQLDFRVELFDVHGYFIRPWNPLLDDMTSCAKNYCYEFTTGADEDLRKRLNLLLAYQLMPAKGFAWIAEHPDALATWLALLNEDPNAAGMLGLILERADAIAIQRDLTQFLIAHEGIIDTGRSHRIGTFIDIAPESSIEKERMLGAEFILWLTKELTKGRFCINKIPIVMLPAGLHLTKEVYQFFMREHPETKHWQAIEKGIMTLGLHQRDATDGLVLEKYAVILPDEVPINDVLTGKEITVSAIEAMQIQQSPNHPEPLLHLSQSGTWHAAERVQSTLQSGFSRRE